MQKPDLTETIVRVAGELAGLPLDPVEAARLAPRLADLLAGLATLDTLELDGVEPLFELDLAV
jgi:hypothetical protein